jgi:hypothetical protein
LEGGNFGFRGGGGSVTSDGTRGTESKACEDADDGDDSEEFDQSEGGLLTQRSQRIVFCEVNIRGDLSELSVC